MQSLKFEDNEPGSTGEGSTNYVQFPAGLTWNNATRVLSGSVTSRPGRLYMTATPNVITGDYGISARGYLDVGPNIISSTISYSNAAASFDLYPITDCGTLVPKVVMVTGLPTGLNFNAGTFLITGTATTGTYTIIVAVTNYSGQAVSQSITLTVGA